MLRGGRPHQHSLAATEFDILLLLWDWKVGGGSDSILLSVTCLPQAGSPVGTLCVQLGGV